MKMTAGKASAIRGHDFRRWHPGAAGLPYVPWFARSARRPIAITTCPEPRDASGGVCAT